MAQGFDEPCHIAAGMKWLDQHDYTLDAIHPPLSRYAIALPLFAVGERFPKMQAEGANRQANCTEFGNAILSGSGHYMRNLLLARLGILPFLCLAGAGVFLWTRHEFGTLAACIAVFLFTTLPSVLAFSSLAYTDLPTMCTQFLCLFAFALWLRKPTWAYMALLGLTAGLALSSKLTSFLFLPLACTGMLATKLWFVRDRIKDLRIWEAVQLPVAVVISLIILWGSYGFSAGHIQNALGVSAVSDVSANSSRGVVRNTLRRIVKSDPVVPAADLVRGIEIARLKNKNEPESYLMGTQKRGGWWYFFPLALALKTPIAFSILAVIGLVCTVGRVRQGQWTALMPAAAVGAVFLATVFVTLRIGTRHVLVVLPLLAVLAGYGAALLWGAQRTWARLVLGILLAWQTWASSQAQDDFLAYFNELAPSDPSAVLVKGCDLDCGQDVFRLSRELRARGVTHVSMGVCSSANMALVDLPALDVLPPRRPVSGWVAVSLRALKTGQFKIIRNGDVTPKIDYPDDALFWLEKYRPIARVGKTILLYDIPQTAVEDGTQINP